jgi:hypothetical protein
MDFANILKLFSPNQRETLICFLVLLPCYFTLLLLYVPSFSEYELLYQSILSITGTIVMMFASYGFLMPSNMLAKSNDYNPLTSLFMNLGVISYVLYNQDSIIEKKDFFNIAVVHFGIVGTILFIVIKVSIFLKKCEDEGR